MKNRFSIITCVWNRAEFVIDTIESVKSQSFTDYEHIFIDGFSTDGTIEVLNEYQRAYPDKVKIYQFEPNGITSAMNKGIELSTGQYLIHLHSDDYFDNKDVLKKIDAFLKIHSDADWVYGNARMVDEQKHQLRLLHTSKYFDKINSSNIFRKMLIKYKSNIIHQQAIFLRRDVFDRFGLFDENFPNFGMESDYWFRIYMKTTWYYFDDIISCVRLHESGMSSSSSNASKYIYYLLSARRKHMNLLQFYVFSLSINVLMYLIRSAEGLGDIIKIYVLVGRSQPPT